MRYLGVDLHTTNFMVCFLSENDERTFRQYKISDLQEFKQSLDP